VFNLITGFGHRAGAALTHHPAIAKVAFTGSTEVGQEIMRAAAGNLKRISLELGGKSPLIIFDDADLETASEVALWAIFANSGQNCVAGSRLFVHSSAYNDVVGYLSRRARELRVGPGMEEGTEIGPLISQQQLDRVLDYIRSGSASSHLVAGGHRAGGRLENGYFLEPTIFSHVEDDYPIATDEIFGPVLSVLQFETEDEVIARANAIRFGLAAGVWTKALGRAHRIAARLKAGVVWVNTYDWFDPAVPFGGSGQSGIGRELGTQVMDMYTELKSVWVKLD
jgi:acyl-CoA reductase-like NAD-dependent aldehyde dehydrogenase